MARKHMIQTCTSSFLLTNLEFFRVLLLGKVLYLQIKRETSIKTKDYFLSMGRCTLKMDTVLYLYLHLNEDCRSNHHQRTHHHKHPITTKLFPQAVRPRQFCAAVIILSGHIPVDSDAQLTAYNKSDCTWDSSTSQALMCRPSMHADYICEQVKG